MNTDTDSAAQFYKIVVAPTVKDYLTHPSDIRLACLAVLVLWSMVDHEFHASGAHSRKERNLAREVFVARGEAFKLIRDVAEATKHAALRDDGKGFTFEQVQASLPPAGGYGAGAIAYNLAGGYIRDDIVVLNSDGSQTSLEPAVRRVFGHWQFLFGPPDQSIGPEVNVST